MSDTHKEKKKVCFMSNGLFRGGTDTFAVNLVCGLDKDKYDITVLLTTDADDGLDVREPEVTAAGVKIARTCSINKGLRGKIKHFQKMYRILKGGKFDVFHTNVDLFNGPNLFIAWLSGMNIRVCHSHNTQQERAIAEGRNWKIIIYQYLMRKMCWIFSNRRCGCSEEALSFLFQERWKNDERAMVINNGIDISSFRETLDIEKKKKEVGIDSKRKCVLSVGRLSAQKNPRMIAEVFWQLCQIREDCDLVWVGIGEMEEELRKYFDKKNISERVHFLGTRGDVCQLMQMSDVFLFPSTFEGLGIVLLEAQAAGLPCLVSDVVPKQVDCGGCQFKSLEDSAYEWAKCLVSILDGVVCLNVDEERLQRYSIDAMVEQVKQLYS